MAQNSDSPSNVPHSTVSTGVTGMKDPLYLSSRDTSEITLVETPFNGKQYLKWSGSVKMALIAKNKLGFITGEYPKPAEDAATYQDWMTVDYNVMCWILNSLIPEISESLQYVTSSKQLWEEIKERYSQANAPKDESVAEDLQSLDGLPECECGAMSKCSCSLLKKVLERDGGMETEKLKQMVDDYYAAKLLENDQQLLAVSTKLLNKFSEQEKKENEEIVAYLLKKGEQVDSLLNYAHKLNDYLNKRHGGFADDIQEVQKQLDLLETRLGKEVQKQLDLLETRLGKEVQKPLDLLETRLGKEVQTRLDLLETRLGKEVQKPLDLLETRLRKEVQTRLDLLETRLGKEVQKQSDLLETRLGKEVQTRLDLLETRLGKAEKTIDPNSLFNITERLQSLEEWKKQQAGIQKAPPSALEITTVTLFCATAVATVIGISKLMTEEWQTLLIPNLGYWTVFILVGIFLFRNRTYLG